MNDFLFENLEFLGDLHVDCVFNEYDCIPVLCVCKNGIGDLFLCHCSDMRGEFRWVISKTSPSIINDLVAKKRTIKECILLGTELFLLITQNTGNDSISCKTPNDIDTLDLPDDNLFLLPDDSKNALDYANRLVTNNIITFSSTCKNSYDCRVGYQYSSNIDAKTTVIYTAEQTQFNHQKEFCTSKDDKNICLAA